MIMIAVAPPMITAGGSMTLKDHSANAATATPRAVHITMVAAVLCLVLLGVSIPFPPSSG